jgi:hypothetical protein
VLGHVLREALHEDLAQVVVDDAALLHAGRLADVDDLHVHLDRLRAAHDQEVHVHDRALDVVPLDLARQHQVLVLVDLQVDQHVGARARMQDLEHVVRVHRQRLRLLAVPVQDRGHAAGGAQLSRDALAVVLTALGGQLGLHRRDIVADSLRERPPSAR